MARCWTTAAFLLLPLALGHAQTGPLGATRRPDLEALRGSGRITKKAAAPASVQARVLPRIICGNGWDTTVLLLNTGSAPVAFQQYFFAPDGKPAAFTVRSLSEGQSLTAPALQGNLNPGSSLNIAFCDAAGTLREGWSLLTYTAGQGNIEGYAVIRRPAFGGGFHFEATVPLSNLQDFSLYMPFDNTAGFRSQITLVNPAANLPAQVRLTYLDPQGKAVLIDALTLQPAEQVTLVLPDVYPDLANKTGTLSVEADIDRLSVMGLRYNDIYGAIVALPAISCAGAMLQ